MKKFLIGVAALALAMSAQAQFYANFKTLAPGSTVSTKGYACYCISANNMATLMGETSLAYSDVNKVASWLQKDFSTRYAQIKTGGGYGMTVDAYSGKMEFRHTNYSTGNIFGVITYTSATDGISYRVFNMNDKTRIEDFATTSSTQGYWTSWNGTEPVPEPTSGLLMLLGVAGLALKRKQK